MEYLPDYISYVYPTSPTIPEAEIRELLAQMHDSCEAASFIYAFAAVTLSLTPETVQRSLATRERIIDFITRSLAYRRPICLDVRPTIVSVVSNIFTEICFNGLQRHDLGFVYLREAISLVDLLQLGTPGGINGVEPRYRARSQRVYWECFIHERFAALTRYKPGSLGPLCELPDHDPSIPSDVERGFNAIINSFRLVDREFLDFWLGNRSEVTVDWVEKKQQELDDYDWHNMVDQTSLLYQADLIITRHWLRTLTWQMALSNFLLSSTTLSPLLSLSFPLRLSNNLRQFLGRLPRTFIGIHGCGLLTKLLEIAITITDVVLHLDSSFDGDAIHRVRDILVIKDFVFSFPGTAALQPAIALTEKLQVIRTKYPEINEVQLLVC